MEQRLANRPEYVPENQFRDLLKYWDSEEAQKISNINKENRQKQGDMHTMSPSSYSMLHVKMKENDPDQRDPSQADVYRESRKRKAGRAYLTPNEEILQNIEKRKAHTELGDGSAKSDPYFDVITKKEHSGRLRLYGRGVTKSTLEKKDPNTPFILPPMFLESITKKWEKYMEEMLENKVSYILSKIREANPGSDLIIPNFETGEGNASRQGDDEVDESLGPSHSQES